MKKENVILAVGLLLLVFLSSCNNTSNTSNTNNSTKNFTVSLQTIFPDSITTSKGTYYMCGPADWSDCRPPSTMDIGEEQKEIEKLFPDYVPNSGSDSKLFNAVGVTYIDRNSKDKNNTSPKISIAVGRYSSPEKAKEAYEKSIKNPYILYGYSYSSWVKCNLLFHSTDIEIKDKLLNEMNCDN